MRGRSIWVTLIPMVCMGVLVLAACGVEPAHSSHPTVEVNFDDMDLGHAVLMLSQSAGIVVDHRVIKQGSLTLYKEDVSAREALDMVLKMNHLALSETDGEYQIVSTIEGENPVLMEPSPRVAPTPNPVIAEAMRVYHEQTKQEWRAKGLTIQLSESAHLTPLTVEADFYNADLAQVVRSLSHEAGIVVDDQVIKQGTVNMKWERVSPREALDMVLKMNLLALNETDGTYQIISTIEGENPALMELLPPIEISPDDALPIPPIPMR